MDAPATPKAEQETNGWVRRVKGLAEILTTPQGILAVIIVLGLGVAIGRIPFAPLDRLTAILERLDRRAQLIDCARLNDVDLRKRCLEK